MTAPTQHTPGPWYQPMRYSPEDGCDIPAGHVEGPMGQLVASFAEFSSLAEVAANARLVTAAPDLLAACEAVTRRAVMLSGFPQQRDAWTGEIVTCRAAIAKARGQAEK